jgi:hypothetical protein
MSSNTQVHVRPRPRVHASERERLSLGDALGPGGAAVLKEVLQKLSDREFDPAMHAQFPWQRVAGREHTFRRKVGEHDVELSLEGIYSRLTVSGIQDTAQIPQGVMRAAHAAVNQVLALAVSSRIANRLNTFVAERAREEISTTVALKALQLQNARLAIRASCGILVKS